MAPILLVPFLLAAAQQPAVRSDTVHLSEVVVTATRVATPLSQSGASTTVLDAEELRRRGRRTLADALQLVSGASPAAAGAAGSVASVFLRGTSSTHTLVLLDGVRQNDANFSAAPLLGGVGLEGVHRLEVVRGPQSTLYGGAAIGGVIALDSDRGAGPLHGTLDLDAGNFGSWRSAVSADGSRGPISLASAFTMSGTDNQRPGNAWHQRTQFLRFDWSPGSVTAGASVRGLQQSFQSPGDLRDQNTTPELATTFENHLVTAWVEAAPTSGWRSRLLLAYQQQFNASSGRWNGGPEARYTLRGDRWVADWQHRIELGRRLRLVAGANREWSRVAADGIPHDEHLFGLYADALALPVPTLALGAGARRDDYSSFGAATTWRFTASWHADRRTRLHSSAGSGFLPPGLQARYGSSFQAANPGIRPERSTGIDLGVDRTLGGDRVTIGVTWFRNSLHDLIGWENAVWPALGRNINVDRARTSGVELTGRARLGPVDLRLAWSALSARAVDSVGRPGDRLIRRPARTLAADLLLDLGHRCVAGAGLLIVEDRRDTDFNQFPSRALNPGDYALLRLHAATEVTAGLQFRLQVENALDARYEPVYGFPALGRSASASIGYRL